jgi:N-acetylglucosaminyldiphosphoundecaprenol N-acetyl-beta-D-mannosaminyltransferase
LSGRTNLNSPYLGRSYTPSNNRYILGTLVDATSYEEATRKIIAWAETGESRYVCAANVHMIMEGFDDPEFKNIINSADLVTPDGMPLVWGLRQLGIKEADQVCGPTLTMYVCEAAANSGIPVALYGGTEESLTDFTALLYDRFPAMRVICQILPPFRPLSTDEDVAYTQQIVASGARILFVGIGCPKQELWMAQHQSKIPAVMLGVGAAFDFHSGRVKRAPTFMQRTGFEWLFRLCMEPRRLWKRYLIHNTRFVFFFGIQLVKAKLRRAI